MPCFSFKNDRYHYLDTSQDPAWSSLAQPWLPEPGDPVPLPDLPGLREPRENPPTLLLLPGNSASSALHRGEIDHYCRGFRVICPDYCGYGRSHRLSELPDDFWMQNAVMCSELLASLGISRAIVMGTSGGGLISLCLAIHNPGLVQAVIADSIPGDYIPPEVAEHVVKGRCARTRFQRRMWERAHGPDWEDVVEADSRLLLRASRLECGPYHGRVSEISCPVLFTGSLADDLIPGIGGRIRDVADRIENSRVALHPSGWHPFMWSMARTFRQEADQFLKSLFS